MEIEKLFESFNINSWNSAENDSVDDSVDVDFNNVISNNLIIKKLISTYNKIKDTGDFCLYSNIGSFDKILSQKLTYMDYNSMILYISFFKKLKELLFTGFNTSDIYYNTEMSPAIDLFCDEDGCFLASLSKECIYNYIQCVPNEDELYLFFSYLIHSFSGLHITIKTMPAGTRIEVEKLIDIANIIYSYFTEKYENNEFVDIDARRLTIHVLDPLNFSVEKDDDKYTYIKQILDTTISILSDYYKLCNKYYQ